MSKVYVDHMDKRGPSTSNNVGTAASKLLPRARYGIRRTFRYLIVASCYRDLADDATLLGLPGGLLLTNAFFQKVLRINGKATFPVHFTSRVTNPSAISLGRGVARYLAISNGCYIQAANGVVIGDHTMIAPGVKIISANHGRKDRDRHVEAPPITIGANCWLAANVVVLPGVTIGEGTTVGAGSVVTHDLPSNCVAVGVPAKPRPTTGDD